MPRWYSAVRRVERVDGTHGLGNPLVDFDQLKNKK
jgi:hypothetical protein